MTKQDAGKLGGLATARKYGKPYMAAIGKRGAAVLWERYTLHPRGLSGWALVDRKTGEIKATIGGRRPW